MKLKNSLLQSETNTLHLNLNTLTFFFPGKFLNFWILINLFSVLIMRILLFTDISVNTIDIAWRSLKTTLTNLLNSHLNLHRDQRSWKLLRRLGFPLAPEAPGTHVFLGGGFDHVSLLLTPIPRRTGTLFVLRLVTPVIRWAVSFRHDIEWSLSSAPVPWRTRSVRKHGARLADIDSAFLAPMSAKKLN